MLLAAKVVVLCSNEPRRPAERSSASVARQVLRGYEAPPDGAVVFVRTLQPTAQRPASPTVYKVEFIGCDSDGLHQFRLNSVQPRYNAEVPPVN